MKVFGPVPSRRLGRSLGVNNIPTKFCTYSCVYCQLGRSILTVERREFFKPDDIFREVERRIESVKDVDYITFVPEGEPTLDVNLGIEIDLLKEFGIEIAVITNSSLIWRRDVRDDLMKADLISLKIDAIDKKIWKSINRPHGTLRLEEILNGISEFANDYSGKLITETMVVSGLNDSTSNLKGIAEFLSEVEPIKAYISIPIRPPAERWVKAPSEEVLIKAYQIFKEHLDEVELLTGYEGEGFAVVGDLRDEILRITSVHPIRKKTLEELIKKAKGDWSVVEELLASGELIEVEYRGDLFYIRRGKP